MSRSMTHYENHRSGLTSRRSQPPLALSVPLSRFTSSVGGGSAFYVRPLDYFMPNGYDKGYVRFCKVINDFRWLHGRWPTRFRMSADQLKFLRQLFTSEEFAKITSKIQIVTDGSGYGADDETGATCEYRHDIPRAADWLGVHLEPHDFRKRAKPWWRFF